MAEAAGLSSFAMPAAATATAERIKEVNSIYHDGAAASYDAKWGIDFGDVGQRQVAMKLRKALGSPVPQPFGDALEIGSGTGYFSLNLMQAGLIERLTATDISQGMLDQLGTTAARLGLDVETVRTDAEALPFPDERFDLVFGHAVLHHVPDLDLALAEFVRVLRPGGVVLFCGEPSRYGDRLAGIPKRVGHGAAPLWRLALGARRREGAASNGHGHELESEVDVHTFAPASLAARLRDAGFEKVRIRGEELLANMYGWMLRSLEADAQEDSVPRGWRTFAFRSYLALQELDTRLLEPRLPPELFYNLVLSARKPS